MNALSPLRSLKIGGKKSISYFLSKCGHTCEDLRNSWTYPERRPCSLSSLLARSPGMLNPFNKKGLEIFSLMPIKLPRALVSLNEQNIEKLNNKVQVRLWLNLLLIHMGWMKTLLKIKLFLITCSILTALTTICPEFL